MINPNLAKDYISAAQLRLEVLYFYFQNNGWRVVIIEAQEAVELASKALLLRCLIDPPRIPDVSEFLLQNKERLSNNIQVNLERICDISRSLCRDRELASYGSEDLTPSTFYKKKDAAQALAQAKWLVELVAKESFKF